MKIKYDVGETVLVPCEVKAIGIDKNGVEYKVLPDGYRNTTLVFEENEIHSCMRKEAVEEYNNGWTPCSERLPVYDEEYFKKHNNHRQYLVTCKDAYAPTIAYFTKEKTWCYDDYVQFNNVVAWMPVPDPYKGDCSGES